MESVLHEVLDTLDSPWGKKCRGLFEGLTPGPCIQWDDLSIIAGTCVMIEENKLVMQLASFVPKEGFHFRDGPECDVCIPGVHSRANFFGSGDRVICCGKIHQVDDRRWVGETQTIAIPFPIFSLEQHWNAVHLFAGAFDGWSQAFGWIPFADPDFLLGTQIHVDSDIEVAQAWVQDGTSVLCHSTHATNCCMFCPTSICSR